jgi:hypothetical protein
MGKSVLSTIGSIMEVAQPLSQGEQNFKALHGVVEPNKNLVPGITDQDHIFNGVPRKEDPKTASYENFRDDDESKEAYDKTLKVSEKPETDKDEEENVKEEVEVVDEAMKGEAEYNARYGKGGKKRKESETEEGGLGRHKVNYVHPDKKNIGNDRFETKEKAVSYANSLKKKGYHEVNVTEETEAVDEAMKGEDEYNARYGKGGKKRPPHDPVGKEDSDINNDGKVDSSDSYLSNRRKVISKYLNKEDAQVVVPVKKVEVKEDDSFVKTDWKEIFTKKAVAEEVEDEATEIVESLKLLKTYTAGNHAAKVYKDTDWDEHRVKFFSGDTHHKDADYHTDDVEDAHDTAKTQLRDMAKKAMKEEAEQIHELSKGTLKSYVKKALDTGSEKSISNLASRGGYETGKSADDDFESGYKYDRKSVVRSQGVQRAVNKLAKEEVEQIDELSPATLGSYKAKAADSEKALTDKSSTLSVPPKERNVAAVKANQRRQGMKLATSKMEEEIQLVDEKHLTVAEKKKREEIAKAMERENPNMPMAKKMAIATATAKKVAEEVEDLDEAQFSRDQLKSAMDALENTKKAAAAEKDMKKRTNHLMRQNFLTKQVSYMRSAIASEGSKKAKMAEEIEAVAEAVDVDVNMHEFMADKAKRAIYILKKNNKPVPDELLRTYEKHKQEINKYRKDIGKPVKEGVDFATARSDRGPIKTYVKYGKNGQTELVSRRAPRAEIKIGEEASQVDEASYSAKSARAGKDIGEKGKNFAAIAKDAAKRYGSKKSGEKVAGSVLAKIRAKHMKEALNNDNMMQTSVDKLKTDPLASKVKIKLPPSQGLKPIGGEDQVHANMAEEKLNRLYESLSDRNKVKFMEKLETEEGFEQLIRFAEEQGF